MADPERDPKEQLKNLPVILGWTFVACVALFLLLFYADVAKLVR